MKTKPVELRFPSAIGDLVKAELDKPSVNYCERVVICLAGKTVSEDKISVIVNKVYPVPEESYILKDAGTAWDHKFTAEVVNHALKLRLGLLIVHKHNSNHPNLSPQDKISFRILLDRFRILMDRQLHGSVVIGLDNSVGGVVNLPGDDEEKRTTLKVTSAVWLGSPIVFWPKEAKSRVPHKEMFNRQIAVIGENGQKRLFSSKVGIVGLGGGGSHVAQQLAHSGVGNFVLIDEDNIELSNMHRLIGSINKDIGKKKTEVITRLIKSIYRNAKTEELAETFPTEPTVKALKSADIIFSCVDTYQARSLLNDFSWRHAIPLVDIGIGTEVSGKKSKGFKLEMLSGHAHIYMPGGPCMWCTGFLTKEKLEAEISGKGPTYVKRVKSPAQIVSANGVVASLAVTEALQLLTGYMARDKNLSGFWFYDGKNERLYSQEASAKESCSLCKYTLGLGDTVW